jgi:hypothetical protein
MDRGSSGMSRIARERAEVARIVRAVVLARSAAGEREPGLGQRWRAEGASRPRARARVTASPRRCVPSLA